MEEPVTLDNCANEPIHVPGAIQPHGVLLAVDTTRLRTTFVSANATSLFGVEPREILGGNVRDLFDRKHADTISRLVDKRSLRELNPLQLETRSGALVETVAHHSNEHLVLEMEATSKSLNSSFDPRMRQAIVRLQGATSVAALTTIAAEEVRSLTGFDRVMVYRFDPAWNGQVVAEAKRESLEPFLGLHYPASDIPEQARRLYTLNWLRHIVDIGYTPVPLLSLEASPTQLDLSHAHLRSVSPIHVEYLTNMGVRASMSISLVADGQLIGLIACHHYSGPKLLDYTLRETCEYLGQALSWNLRVLEHSDGAERSRMIREAEAEVATSLAGAEDLLDGLANPALAAIADAPGAAVVLEEGVRRVGSAPDERKIAELVGWLHARGDDVFVTDHLSAHYEPAKQWDSVAAGLLAVTVSQELGEYLLWFRPSTERTVDWAGDPRKLVAHDDRVPPRLSPRGSFALWRETVRGRALPWDGRQVEAASNLRRLLIGGARRRAATLRALNQRLVEADRAKDVFIATVSHELRTPLNAISGWSRLLVDGKLPTSRHGEAVRVVARNADALTRQVDDLLDVSRMISGNIALDVESVDVDSMVESVIVAMTVAAEAKGIRLKCIAGGGPTTVLGDVARLRQVVSNILSNAIKFTPKEGSIVIAVRRLSSDVEISVKDSGPGLDPSLITRVFDAFWQADSSTTRQSQGLGLGLAIARKLVELHGGRISAESAGLGHGATFRITLPVASARVDLGSMPPVPPSPGEPIGDRLLEGVAISIIEDDPDSRELLRHILEMAGASVRLAADAPAGLELLGTGRTDVIVSDVGMPGMDGLEMIAKLRGDAGSPAHKAPAVALTAFTRSIDRTTALRGGFQAHVPKPADPEELVTVVASLVGRL